eukprot:TRINITY_DN6327_c0_g2_i4.p1 TRINITY_DN6327_c0_g2~~TRINITY_DN6327_c0_g2_i4.p1  ORF type:complete len:678 (+),score=234.48 TRINITY_DN6327_c0_g2_i4:99-2036(+)
MAAPKGSVFYKLKSARDFDVIEFDGDRCSVGKLKELIALKLKLVCKDYDIVLSNHQTEEKYQSDTATVLSGSSLLMERVPLEDKWRDRPDFIRQLQWKEQRAEAEQDIERLTRAPRGGALGRQTLELPQTEEERIVMMRNDAEDSYNATKLTGHLASRRGMGKGSWGGRGKGGNMSMSWGKGSKPAAPRLLPPTGIPSALLVECEEGDPRARYKDRGGRVLRLKEDDTALAARMRAAAGVGRRPGGDEVPDDLRCTLCDRLFSDAVKVGCCGDSFCGTCLDKHLDDNGRRCPSADCGEAVSGDMLTPAVRLRKMCDQFLADLSKKTPAPAPTPEPAPAKAPPAPPRPAAPPTLTPEAATAAAQLLKKTVAAAAAVPPLPTREEFERMKRAQQADQTLFVAQSTARAASELDKVLRRAQQPAAPTALDAIIRATAAAAAAPRSPEQRAAGPTSAEGSGRKRRREAAGEAGAPEGRRRRRREDAPEEEQPRRRGSDAAAEPPERRRRRREDQPAPAAAARGAGGIVSERRRRQEPRAAAGDTPQPRRRRREQEADEASGRKRRGELADAAEVEPRRRRRSSPPHPPQEPGQRSRRRREQPRIDGSAIAAVAAALQPARRGGAPPPKREPSETSADTGAASSSGSTLV